MSDNYKVIARARDAFNKLLKEEGWSINQVVKETGLNHSMVCQIRDEDPVGIKVWDVTIEKIKAFLEKYDAGIDKPVRKKAGPKITRGKKGNEFSIPVPESMADAIPPDRGIESAPGADKSSGNDLMDELNALGARFKMKGWNLEAKLSKIFVP